MYVQPPQVKVRSKPMDATNPGSFELGLRVRMYHRPTSAKRGPARIKRIQKVSFLSSHGAARSLLPDVMAMKIIKNERSGYRSPIVAETDGNHSSGYP
jgi:hypothetical protein